MQNSKLTQKQFEIMTDMLKLAQKEKKEASDEFGKLEKNLK
jgi:hypothetical protein